MSREGVPLVVIQRQLGHADLGVTSVYLRGIDNTEIVHAVHERPRTDDPCSQRASADALSQTIQGPRRLARPAGPRPAGRDPGRWVDDRPDTPAGAFR